MLSYFLGFCPSLCVSFILRLEIKGHVGYRCDICTQKHPEEEERLYLYSWVRKFSWKPLASFSFTSLTKIMSHFHALVKITHWEGKWAHHNSLNQLWFSLWHKEEGGYLIKIKFQVQKEERRWQREEIWLCNQKFLLWCQWAFYH